MIITLVILTVMSVFSHNGSNIFSGAVNTVTKGLSTLTAGAASSDKSKEELEKENEQLKKENAELREQLACHRQTATVSLRSRLAGKPKAAGPPTAVMALRTKRSSTRSRRVTTT